MASNQIQEKPGHEPLFDKLVDDAHKAEREATEHVPSQDRLRRWLHDLPFLSPMSLLVFSLIFISALHGTGIWLFSRGFLLTRQALDEINDCRPYKATGELDASCTMPATHSKLVFLVIDALRADFVLPVSTDDSSSAHFYANQLTLPARLTDEDPTRSFLAHFIADAPTTTLQRIKGLTTGSLPTFIDAGSNFAGQAILEDNWLLQAHRAGKRLRMVGDETWLKVFPANDDGVWAINGTRPFDSFHVEDLDTVDGGVEEHLLSALNGSNDWDILVAHNLGLDHAGHRFGAEHSETTRKLGENNDLLRQVVDKLDDDTLLVVIGDHGMTDRGDHGGDSREEVDAALWVYSKGPPLTHVSWARMGLLSERHPIAPLLNASMSASDLADKMLLDWPSRGLPVAARSVSQVDLVPTLTLLLGLPIPFGNLGQPIPELFFRTSKLPAVSSPQTDAAKPKRSLFGRQQVEPMETLSPLSTLLHAYLLSASQLSQYLASYTSRAGGSDLARFMPELSFHLEVGKSAYRGAHAPGHSRIEMERKALEKFWTYGRRARERARSVWARFDPVLMCAGLAVWLGSIVVGLRIVSAANCGSSVRELIGRGVEGALAATWLTLAVRLIGLHQVIPSIFGKLPSLLTIAVAAELAVVCAPIPTASTTLEAFGLQRLGGFRPALLLKRTLPMLPVLVHAAAFASNSFTVFEDSVVSFLLVSLLLVSLVRALGAPEDRLRRRLVLFSIAAIVCVRLMAFSTSCREEQAPNCHVTFYQPSGSLAAVVPAVLALLGAFFVPTLLRSLLALSASDVAIAPPILGILVRGLLLCGSLYWAADRTISGLELGPEGTALATSVKTAFARVVLVGAPLLATLVWWYTPLCLRVQKEVIRDGQGNAIKSQVSFIGFANALGSSYLLLFAAVYALVYLVNPAVGQVVLVLQLVVIACLLEVFDSERDVQHLVDLISSSESLDALLQDDSPLSTPSTSIHSGPTTTQLVMLSLLAHVSFFATGHQATFPSIQWSTAFVGFPKLTYPFSPALVTLNTLGASHVIVPLAVPLFVLWNLSPTLRDQPPLLVPRHVLRACTTFMTIEAFIGLSTAVWAAWFRRHLFVWKVFAPRFMLSAIQITMMDFVLVVAACAWGVRGVMSKANKTLGTKVAE